MSTSRLPTQQRQRKRKATPYPGRTPASTTQSANEYTTDEDDLEYETAYMPPVVKRAVTKSPKVGKKIVTAPAQPAKRQRKQPLAIDTAMNGGELAAAIASLQAQLNTLASPQSGLKKKPSPRAVSVPAAQPKTPRKPRPSELKKRQERELARQQAEQQAQPKPKRARQPAKPRTKKQKQLDEVVDGVFYDQDNNLVDANGDALPPIGGDYYDAELGTIPEGDEEDAAQLGNPFDGEEEYEGEEGEQEGEDAEEEEDNQE